VVPLLGWRGKSNSQQAMPDILMATAWRFDDNKRSLGREVRMCVS